VHSEMPTGESRLSPRRKQGLSRVLVNVTTVGWTRRYVGPRVINYMSLLLTYDVCGCGSLVCAAELLRDGGCLEGFQLWVNLEAKDKMVPPRSVPIPDRHAPFPSASRSRSNLPPLIGTQT
jgi:hypothetical protein